MAASYPGSIKSFTDKTDSTDVIRASHINDLQDEVVAVETQIGITSSPASGSVRERLDSLEAADLQLDVKNSCQLATTANITLSGEQSIDGITTSSSRVLVKDQSTGSQNGIYVSNSSAWVRATDFDANAEVTAGAFTWVTVGTANTNTGWVLNTGATAITVGTTALTFAQYSAAFPYDWTASDGSTTSLVSDGDTFTFTGGTGITSAVSGDAVTHAIDSTVTTLTGSQTLTNKVLTSPDVNAPDIDGGTVDAITSLTVANDVDVGAFEIRALKFESDQATGTAPLAVASTTLVTNLNADKVDGADLDTGTSLGTSDVKVPSQAAVKAYVDAQVTAQDLDFQGDSGGALSIDLDSETLDIAGGAGVDTSGSSNTLTVAIDSTVTTLTGSQTLTNKTLTSPVFNTGVSGSAVLDSDTMSGASATTVASTESIVAYVATQIATEDTIAELNDTDVSSEASGNILVHDGSNSWDNKAVSGDATLASTGAVTIAADAVTYAKIQNVTATDRLLGRDSAGAGIIEEITPANTRTMLGLGALAVLDSVAAGQIDTNAVDSAELVDGSIDESHLSATNSATDNYLLSYDSGTSGFTWVVPAAADAYTVSVSGNDSTPGYLNGKLVAGSNITFTEGSDGGNETLTIAGAAGGVTEGDAIAFAIALG